jgi:hypothetical protein
MFEKLELLEIPSEPKFFPPFAPEFPNFLCVITYRGNQRQTSIRYGLTVMQDKLLKSRADMKRTEKPIGHGCTANSKIQVPLFGIKQRLKLLCADFCELPEKKKL